MAGWRDLPAIYRHCVVAVYRGKMGGGPDGIVRAMKIARANLTKGGHLFPGGHDEIIQNIRLTGKGFKANAKHLREGFAGSSKDLQFAQLFSQIEPKLYELERPGSVVQGGPASSNRGDAEKQKAAVQDRAAVPVGIKTQHIRSTFTKRT